jgi:hypothetical protein
MPARRTSLQTDEQRLQRLDALFARHVAHARGAVGGWKRAFPQLGLARAGGPGDGLSLGAVRRYARGEQVVAEGEVLPGLYLILSGHVALTVRDGARSQP